MMMSAAPVHRVVVRAALVLVAGAIAACRSRAGANSAPMHTYDGTVAEVVTQLATQQHVAAVIDPSAHEIASCAHIRVSVPGDVQPSAAVGLLDGNLREIALRVVSNGSSWSISRDPSVLHVAFPRECRGHPPFATDPFAPGTRPEMPVAPMPPRPVPGSDPASPDAGASLADVAAGVNRRSDSQFDITRRALDAFVGNQARLLGTARIVPSQHEGVVTGVRLYGIRRGSTLDLLGFQNGDELQTINGFDVSSPERALEAYARIRGASELRVGMVRRGAPLELVYRVTP
jgi:hypothetical protein